MSSDTRPPVAIIRAAGRGERMGEVAQYFQKCALPIAGRPLIIHWMDALRSCGVSRCHVIWGHHGRQIIESVQIYEDQQVQQDGNKITTFSAADLRQGIWRDTRKQMELFPYLRGRQILFCYGDNYSPFLRDIIAAMLEAPVPIGYALAGLIPVRQCSSRTQQAIVEERLEGGAYRMTDYLTGLSDAEGWAWAGIAMFPPEILEIDADDTVEVLAHLARDGRLAGIHIGEPYCDIMAIWEEQESDRCQPLARR